jgi:hypothetical protein
MAIRTCIAILMFGAVCASAGSPAMVRQIASRIGAVILTDGDGRVLKTNRARVPVGKFDLSPDRARIVFTPANAKPNGGHLYQLDLATNKMQRLTGKPVFTKGEVYADPEFSPDGQHIVFAIHARPVGDMVSDAGPFATMDLTTRKITILDATRNWGGVDPVFGFDPHWSSDGTRILLNVQGTFAITDSQGKGKQEMGRYTEEPGDDRATYAFGWLGPQCVVYSYFSGYDFEELSHSIVYLLNLKTFERAMLDAQPIQPSVVGGKAAMIEVSMAPDPVAAFRNSKGSEHRIELAAVSPTGLSFGAVRAVPEGCR